jgi:hypothetical protein
VKLSSFFVPALFVSCTPVLSKRNVRRPSPN